MKSDFNGDGKADVLWQNTSGSRAIWLMNGSTFGSSIFLPSVATSCKIVGSGDFNGDDKPDILWQNSSGARHLAHEPDHLQQQCLLRNRR